MWFTIYMTTNTNKASKTTALKRVGDGQYRHPNGTWIERADVWGGDGWLVTYPNNDGGVAQSLAQARQWADEATR